jgi:hypothetical protein
MEQRSRDRLLVEMELGADLGDAERMLYECLAGSALLPFVGPRRERESPAEEVAIGVLDIRLDVLDQLVDEILMTLLGLDNGHGESVLRALEGS